MNRNKDQILLENIYSDIRKTIHNASTDDMGRDIETQEFETPKAENGSDYEQAEDVLEKALYDNGLSIHSVDQMELKSAVEKIVATMQHSPQDVDSCVENCIHGLMGGGSEEGPRDDFEEGRPFESTYESKTILNAYRKVISEASKKLKGKVGCKKCKYGDDKNVKKSNKTVTDKSVKK